MDLRWTFSHGVDDFHDDGPRWRFCQSATGFTPRVATLLTGCCCILHKVPVLHMRRTTPLLERAVDWLVVAALGIGCSTSSCKLPTSTELNVSVSNYDQVPAVRLELT